MNFQYNKYSRISILFLPFIVLASLIVIYSGHEVQEDIRNILGILVVTFITVFLLTYRSSLIFEKKYFIDEEIKEAHILVDKYIPVSRTDINGNITYINSAMSLLTGYSQEELLGQNHRILRDPMEKKEIYKNMWDQISNGKIWKGEVKNRAKNGKYYYVNTYIHPIFDKDNQIIAYQALREDITYKKELEFLSSHDKLTNIYNRSKFDQLLEYELEQYTRYKKTFSLAMLDIDYFKRINDNYGHQVGDSVLIEIVKVIKNQIRESDVISRWGGEEFMIMLPYTNIDESHIVMKKIQISIQNHTFQSVGKMTLSSGLSEVLVDDTAFSIMKRIDSALYKAKESGRNSIVIT